MTGPLSYVPREPTAVQAMFFDGLNAAAISAWVTPLLSPSGSVYAGPYSMSLNIVDGDFQLSVPRDAYIYLDNGVFNSADKGAFELVKKLDDGI